jgi:hypothetical protein
MKWVCVVALVCALALGVACWLTRAAADSVREHVQFQIMGV